MSHIAVVKRRINRLMREIGSLERQLEALGDELPVPDPAEMEEMLAGRKPFSYEALLLGLLGSIHFHLAEATVSLWGEGYSKYTPSTFSGEIIDPHVVQGLKNVIQRRERS
jgi:hypothetical protein